MSGRHPLAEQVSGVVEGGRRREEDAVYPVEKTTVTRNDHPGVLDAATALQERFEQVPQLAEHAEEQGGRHAVACCQLREKGRFDNEGSNDAPGESAERTLHTFVRTDGRIELV